MHVRVLVPGGAHVTYAPEYSSAVLLCFATVPFLPLLLYDRHASVIRTHTQLVAAS